MQDVKKEVTPKSLADKKIVAHQMAA